MTKLLFDIPQTSVAIVGRAERFPVRRVFCVGRNYAAHAREMGKDPTKEPPFFFMKPSDAVVADGSLVPYPPSTSNFHHEIELVVAIGEGGRDIAVERALEHVYGWAVGLDLTRRDLQLAARDAGRPWDWGKAFDNSAPCGAIVEHSNLSAPPSGNIWLKVNNETRQTALVTDLIWSVPEIISTISSSVELRPGDLIYTGTPEGVGPVVEGDLLVGGVDGLGEISIRIGERA